MVCGYGVGYRGVQWWGCARLWKLIDFKRSGPSVAHLIESGS